MQHIHLSFDILDYIFSFLISDRKTLIACPKDPVLSPIVERHAYYHIIVQVGERTTDFNNILEPNHLSKLCADKPHIVSYIRILQIEVGSSFEMVEMDDSFAATLLMFPVLECVKLRTWRGCWDFLDPCRAALEDRLSLPTVKELHLTSAGIPFPLLNVSKNIENLSLSGSYVEYQHGASTFPQPHSLRLPRQNSLPSLLSWLKIHVKELRSLKSAVTNWEVFSKLLGACSGTLNKLDFLSLYIRNVVLSKFF